MKPTYSMQEKRDLARDMRKNPTRAEAALWLGLNRNQIGFPFSRQAVIQGYIVDFWCGPARLAVEVDGSVHEREDHGADDEQKDAILERSGIGVLRFTNEVVLTTPQFVLSQIYLECRTRIGLKAVGFDLPSLISKRKNKDSSSNRACWSLQNSRKTVASTLLPGNRPVEIPPDQRLTEQDYRDFARKFAILTRQRSLPFERPLGERAWEAKLRLAEYLKKQPSPLPQSEKEEIA